MTFILKDASRLSLVPDGVTNLGISDNTPLILILASRIDTFTKIVREGTDMLKALSGVLLFFEFSNLVGGSSSMCSVFYAYLVARKGA